MNDAKELKYQGMQPEVDVMPKVKYEDIPEKRRKKWASHRGLNTTAPSTGISTDSRTGVKGLVNEDTFKNFIIAPKFEDDKEFYGRKIYVRKMERLYHLIRLYKTRDWWE